MAKSTEIRKIRRLVPVVLAAAVAAGCSFASTASEETEESAGESYSCSRIPVMSDELSWGMDRDEAIFALGEPDFAEEEEYGSTLTWKYGEAAACELGNCSELVLYIGEENLKDANGTVLSQGLCAMDMTLEETTREEVQDALETFYGEFSEDSGSTAMELHLKAAMPGYLNEDYFCDEWKLESLEEEEYRRLSEIAGATYDWIGTIMLTSDQDTLMHINLSGNAAEDTYSCKVSLSAANLTVIGASRTNGSEPVE